MHKPLIRGPRLYRIPSYLLPPSVIQFCNSAANSINVLSETSSPSYSLSAPSSQRQQPTVNGNYTQSFYRGYSVYFKFPNGGSHGAMQCTGTFISLPVSLSEANLLFVMHGAYSTPALTLRTPELTSVWIQRNRYIAQETEAI